jgi:hypothetical protein
MKLLVLTVAYLIAVAGSVSGQPNQTADNNQKPASSTAQAIVTAEHESAAHHTAKADDDAPHWYTPLKRPEWWLVGVGFVTFFAIWRQVKEAAHATRAMQKSTELQMIALRQTVEVEERGVDAHESKKDGSLKLVLTFEAVNNTGYALTIEQVVTTLELLTREPIKFTVRESKKLAPSVSSGMNRYPFFVSTTLEGKDVDRFLTGTIVGIFGQITFVDCLQETQVQDFGGMYSCSTKEFKYMKPMGAVPEEQRVHQNNQPHDGPA